MAGGGQQGVLRVDLKTAAGLGGGAALAQRAVPAPCFELGLPVAVNAGAAQGDGVAGRAGDGAGLVIDGEVVDGEAAGDGRLQRRWFDHRGVAFCLEALAQFPGAVGGVAEDG